MAPKQQPKVDKNKAKVIEDKVCCVSVCVL
jgi:hypothetical protein